MPDGCILPCALIICSFFFLAVLSNLQKSCKNYAKKSLIPFPQVHQLLTGDVAPLLSVSLSLALPVPVGMKQCHVLPKIQWLEGLYISHLIVLQVRRLVWLSWTLHLGVTKMKSECPQGCLPSQRLWGRIFQGHSGYSRIQPCALVGLRSPSSLTGCQLGPPLSSRISLHPFSWGPMVFKPAPALVTLQSSPTCILLPAGKAVCLQECMGLLLF